MKIHFDADYKAIKPGSIIRSSEAFSGYTNDEFVKHKFVLENTTSIPRRNYDYEMYNATSIQTTIVCEDGTFPVVMENLYLDVYDHYTLVVLDIDSFVSEHLIPWGGKRETVTFYKMLITELSRVLWVNLHSLHGSCTIILE